MRISKPEIVRENRRVVQRTRVQWARGDAGLWYSLDESFSELVSSSSDAALAALLIPAMAAGEDIEVAGTISERLLYNLSRPLQRVFRHVIPALRPVAIRADEVAGGRASPAAGVATGFSGGIDSYCVLADHHYSTEVPARFKVSHLLFNNVGSHATGEPLFEQRHERLRPAVERLGLPFVVVNSNLSSFYDEDFSFQQTHTPRNASVALLLQGGIGRFLYASAYAYPDAFVGPSYDMAYSDTVTLPLLSTESLDAFSVGSEYTRVEKTLRVAELPDSHATLDVCANAQYAGGYANCSTCWKCLRTLATLEIAGRLERYTASFDLDAYRRHRREYFSTLLASRDPLLREIVEFAAQRGYSLPISSRLAHATRVDRVAGLAKRVVRKLTRSSGGG